MSTQCAQQLSNGKPCNAPTLNGSTFCRHHHPGRPQKPAVDRSSENEPLALPPLLDKPRILAALNEVVQALAEGRIKRSVAETLLSAIKLANRLLTEIAEQGLVPLAPGTASHLQLAQASSASQRPRTDDRLASAIAASSDHRKPNPFSTARPSSLLQPEIDPDTARIVKDLLAQSHQLAHTQSLSAKKS